MNEISKEYELNLKKMLDKNEIKRLKRALKDNNDNKVIEWADQLEYCMKNYIEAQYNKKFELDLVEAIDIFRLGMVYTLCFSEETDFDKPKIKSLMDDLEATIELFSNGEFTPEEYLQELKTKKDIDLFNNLESIRKDIDKINYDRMKRKQYNLNGIIVNM